MLLAPIEPWALCETCRLRCWRLAAACALPGGAALPGTLAARTAQCPRAGAGHHAWARARSVCVSAWVSVCSLRARRGAAASPAGSARRPLRVLAPSVRAGTAASLHLSAGAGSAPRRLRWAAGEVRPAPGGSAPRRR